MLFSQFETLFFCPFNATSYTKRPGLHVLCIKQFYNDAQDSKSNLQTRHASKRLNLLSARL